MSLPSNVRVLSALDPNHAAYDISDAGVMEQLSRAEDAHFWHLARNAFIAQHLERLGARPPATVLELGCGGGCVSAHLASCGFRVTGVDGHLPRVLEAARRAQSATFLVADLTKGVADLPVEQDVVGLFDVLEHLVDPGAALADALGLVRPGGLLVGTVPALMALWSQVDVSAGHQTRFDKQSLGALLRAVDGAELVEMIWFNRLLAPMMWARRRAMASKQGDLSADLALPSPVVNGTLLRALRVEYAFERALERTPVPGASLWFALRKRR